MWGVLLLSGHTKVSQPVFIVNICLEACLFCVRVCAFSPSQLTFVTILRQKSVTPKRDPVITFQPGEDRRSLSAVLLYTFGAFLNQIGQLADAVVYK